MSENSATDSLPIECYRFDVHGYAVPFRYTSDAKPVTAEGELFNVMKGLKRSRIVTSTGDAKDLTITCPQSSSLARAVGFFKTARKVELTLLRYQRDDLENPTMRVFSRMKGATIQGEEARLKFPNVFADALSGRVPKNKTQGPCNNLFGTQNGSACKKDLSTIQAAVIDLVRLVAYGPEYVVTAVYPGVVYSPLFWPGGTIAVTVGSFTEIRTIYAVSNLPTSGDPAEVRARIKLSEPFSIPLTSYTAVVTPGCDQTLARCHVYENSANFMGFPLIPTERLNPFRSDMSKGRKL